MAELPPLVTLASIEAAAAALPDQFGNSPVIPWPGGGWLKLESLQPTGSFKVRGAWTKLVRLSAECRARGVVAYSSGNHGIAVLGHPGKHGGLPTSWDCHEPRHPPRQGLPDGPVKRLVAAARASRERDGSRDDGGHVITPERPPGYVVGLGISQRRLQPCGLLLRRDLDRKPPRGL